MKVGFTGTQIGMSERQKVALRAELAKATEFHHGDCVGADAEADQIARELGTKIHIHPPINPSKRAFCYRLGDVIWPEDEYLARNHDIVNATRELIAAPKSDREELRSGTWATIRYASRMGKVVRILSR